MAKNVLVPIKSGGLPSEAGRKTAYRTIAYFSSSPGGLFSYEKWQMWRGLADAARDRGVNLLYIAGEEFETNPQAILYNLIGKHNVDGIIVWGTFFSPRSDVDKTRAYIAQFHPLPVVSIELGLEGCSNLLVDNLQGTQDVLAHLIEHHGYRRIAFITEVGSFSAKERQNAYEWIMIGYGHYDPRLVGSLAELDGLGLAPGKDYQAVVAPDDSQAVKVIEQLRSRGINVPEDVAVTGFNDGLEARGSMPPLTTVRLPFRKIGQRAVEMLLNRIEGEVASEVTLLPLQLIMRRSCGCLDPLSEQAAVGPVTHATTALLDVFIKQRAEILAEMLGGMGTTLEEQAYRWSEALWDIFTTEIKRQLMAKIALRPSELFLRRLSELLSQAVSEGININRWHEALSTLRRRLLPYLDGVTLSFVEDLWQQARVLVAQMAARAEVHRSWQSAQRTEVLREIEAGLLISFDTNELYDILVQGLRRLHIPAFYLVLYQDLAPPEKWARLVLAYRDGERINLLANGEDFPSIRLLPEKWIPTNRTYNMVIESLHLTDEQIGCAVFFTDPPGPASECVIYQALRIQLSSALKGVRLRQNLQAALQQAEEANQLKSRFLSMVSHELRTPLNLIVVLSEMALRQQQRGSKASAEVLQKFLEQINVSGQHLDRLIRDVLDLTSSQVGQMNLICQPLDLLPVLSGVASMGSQLAEQKNLEFHVDIPAQLPKVWGDKTRLRQILLNLLSNAVKFTAHGEVALKTILEKDQIVISVRDTGLGITKGDQDKIFGEFYQSDRTILRGYEGIGLGLAITRRLVEMHGGTIWVTSSEMEGGGSTFSFTLPVMRGNENEEMDSVLVRSSIVLLLTKNSASGQTLFQHLTHQGFIVEQLALGETQDYIERLLASPPGAVVLDLEPGSEQGWDIMKVLKENPGTQDIPVLFYSLLAEEDAGSVIEMEYLTKPIGADQLIHALERHGLRSTEDKGGQTILIVDDEVGILDLHARMIQSELPDCRILTARDGREGLVTMRQHLPDLVLLDLMMPELDGFGVLKAMQDEQNLRNIPVIVLSGQVLTARDMSRLNRGVAAVLGKGLFSTQETLERIEGVLARNKQLGSGVRRAVYQAMAFIHEHYQEPLSRTELANHLNLNEQYLSRVFKKEVGLGLMAYLNRYRIQQAKRLLDTGTLTITKVALEVGISSQSYCSRKFQHETGCSPTAYQRMDSPEKRK